MNFTQKWQLFVSITNISQENPIDFKLKYEHLHSTIKHLIIKTEQILNISGIFSFFWLKNSLSKIFFIERSTPKMRLSEVWSIDNWFCINSKVFSFSWYFRWHCLFLHLSLPMAWDFISLFYHFFELLERQKT